MSETQNSLPSSHSEAGSRDCTMNDTSELVEGVGGKPCSEFGIDEGGELGGHTLLSRPSAPQGRRSLFRR